MYPRNAASPPRIAIGPVVQISDGAVQTSGCTVRVLEEGGSEGDGGGTTAYSTDGVVLYTPTQGETDQSTFILIAKKTGCIPASVTVCTTNNATAGNVNVGSIGGTTQTGRDLGASVLLSSGTGTGQISLSSGAVTAGTVSDKTGYSLTATTGLGNQTANITGNLSGSVGSVTGAVGSVAAGGIAAVSFAAGAIDAAAIATDAIGSDEIAAGAVTKIQSGLATAAELAKVPKSDGTTTWNATALASLQAEATDALNAYDPPTKAELDAAQASVTLANGAHGGAAATMTLGGAGGLTATLTGNVGGNVVGSVGSLATQAKADVNAEVVDALNVDTYAEPGQEAPGATVSLVKKIGYLYKAWRNKSTQTATTTILYADGGSTTDQKTTVSDDGTTTTKGEMGTGA